MAVDSIEATGGLQGGGAGDVTVQLDPPVSRENGGTGMSVTTTGQLLNQIGALPRAGGTMSGTLTINQNTGPLPTSTPQAPLRIGGADGVSGATDIYTFGGAAGIHYYRANGTNAAPSTSFLPLADNDQIGLFGLVHGWDGAAWTSGRGGIAMNANNNWSTANHGTLLRFYTTAHGATNQAIRMTIGTGVMIGSPAGTGTNNITGDMGHGTLNVERLFIAGAEMLPGTGSALPLVGGTISGTPGTLTIEYSGAVATTNPLTLGTTGAGGASRIKFENAAGGQWQVGNGFGSGFQIYNDLIPGATKAVLTITQDTGLVNIVHDFHVTADTVLDGDLHVTGDVEFSGNFTPPSDPRLKEHIEPWQLGLDAVCALQPIAYQWNGRGGIKVDGRRRVGLDADHTNQVFPEMVGQSSRELDGTPIKTIAPEMLTYTLINAVKELANRLEALERSR